MTLVKTISKTVRGDCSDVVKTWNDFLYHVATTPGVTTLGTLRHDFPGGGFTGLVLLGESHAAIHTWPELNQAWIELATCGDPAGLDYFAGFKLTPPPGKAGHDAE